jgi:hypothetical protein
MTDSEKAAAILEALQAAEREPPAAALPILNGLIGMVQGDPGQPLEVEEARSATFMAICEVAKALHRGLPAEQLWTPAVAATQKWKGLVR